MEKDCANTNSFFLIFSTQYPIINNTKIFFIGDH